MTQTNQDQVTMDELVATNQQITQEILQSDQALPILNHMDVQLMHQVLLTSHFTMPVAARLGELDNVLNDAPAFRETFHTFLADIHRFQQALGVTRDKLKSANTLTSDKRQQLLENISSDYSQLMSEFDTVIHPMHKTLYNVIADQAPHMLVGNFSQTEEGQ